MDSGPDQLHFWKCANHVMQKGVWRLKWDNDKGKNQIHTSYKLKQTSDCTKYCERDCEITKYLLQKIVYSTY